VKLEVLNWFNDAVSSLDYIALDDGMINEKMNCKGIEGSGCGLS
jgi:hypothetical protein